MSPFVESIVWHGMVLAIDHLGRMVVVRPDSNLGVLVQTLNGTEEDYLPATRALRAMLDARKQ